MCAKSKPAHIMDVVKKQVLTKQAVILLIVPKVNSYLYIASIGVFMTFRKRKEFVSKKLHLVRKSAVDPQTSMKYSKKTISLSR